MPQVPYPRPRSTPRHRAERGRVEYDPWIEHLAWLMDSSVGIGRWSVGVDGILGLIPGFGDVAASLVSMLIVMRAVRAGVPRVAVARMVANIALDTLAGTVPLAGDLFDFAYKANIRNLRIYQESLENGTAANRRHWLFFGVLALMLLAVLAIPILVIVLLLQTRGLF